MTNSEEASVGDGVVASVGDCVGTSVSSVCGNVGGDVCGRPVAAIVGASVSGSNVSIAAIVGKSVGASVGESVSWMHPPPSMQHNVQHPGSHSTSLSVMQSAVNRSMPQIPLGILPVKELRSIVKIVMEESWLKVEGIEPSNWFSDK